MHSPAYKVPYQMPLLNWKKYIFLCCA